MIDVINYFIQQSVRSDCILIFERDPSSSLDPAFGIVLSL